MISSYVVCMAQLDVGKAQSYVTFTARMIVVTAMTGVAATIIQGETTHGELYLNQQKELEPEQIELWEDAKLLIIDKISFASKHNFHMIHRNVSKLKQEFTKKYGGINIIFSCDFRQLGPVGSRKIVHTLFTGSIVT